MYSNVFGDTKVISTNKKKENVAPKKYGNDKNESTSECNISWNDLYTSLKSNDENLKFCLVSIVATLFIIVSIIMYIL